MDHRRYPISSQQFAIDSPFEPAEEELQIGLDEDDEQSTILNNCLHSNGALQQRGICVQMF